MSGTGHLSELESLRLQVADLSRALAERDRHLDRSLQDQSEQSDLLRTIVEGTAADTGEEFFRSLVRHLAQALKVRYAFVGEWRQETPGTVRALAAWSGSALAEPFEYHLQSTPCDKVVGQRMCLYESGVQRLFPEDHLLVQMEAESYCGTPLFDRSGKPLGLLVVMDDRPMTRAAFVKDLLQIFAMRAAAELQRQQADEALRVSERRLRLTQFALDHAQDSVLWADDSKRFVYANEAACRSLGYSKEELLRLSIPDIFQHHDPARVQQRAEEIRQGGVATFESLHQRRGGTEFPVEISITYLEHEGKGYTCGILRDITARKRIEQERLQSWYDLQNILETVPDVMFTFDTQGNLVNWNRRLGDVTGYSPEELLNKPALAFVPMEERDRTMSAIQQAFTEGYAELDGNMLTKEHRLIPYHWTSALLKNPHGEPIGITGVGRDVSDKKRAEEELKQQRRHLVDAQAIAHLGSWEWDIDSGEAQWSDELHRIFGHEPGSIRVTYDTFLAAMLPDDHDLVLAAINNALIGKSPTISSAALSVRTVTCVSCMRAAKSIWMRPATRSAWPAVLDITERKQVEDALRASEERWQLAVRGSNDGIWDWDIQTGDVFFSSRWKAMLGFEDHEIASHVDEWRSRIYPDDLDRVLQNLDSYLAKLRPDFCEEYRVQRKDGSYMWVLDRGVALWADDGMPLRMVGSESDITEQRLALFRLAEQESLLRSILDAEPECVKRVAADGTLLQMNEAGLCFIEADSFEQVAGRSVYDLVAPEFLELYRSMHEAVIQGASQQLEFQIVGLKGTRRWMETHAVPLQNPIDHRVEHLAVTRDISERKRAEEALHESEQRFALAVEGSTDILWDAHRLPGEPWYAPQTLIWWSPRVRELLGLEESESFSTLDQWSMRLHPDDKDRVFGQLAAHIEHRVPYDAEYRLRTNRGDYRWIRGRGQAMWDEQGEVRRMSGSCQDITERKANEQLLAAEKRVLEMIATDAPLQEVLTLVCRVIEELSNGAHCSILLLDRDGLHLHHGAAPSLPEAYVHAIDGVAIGPTVGSCGTAAFMRRQVIVSDIARDPLWADFRDLALRHGFQACWSTPVISPVGTLLGTFAVYYREPQQPTHADLRLIERAAHIACIVIERKQAEQALAASEDRYRALYEENPSMYFTLATDGTVLTVNQFGARQLGYVAEELVGRSAQTVFHKDDRSKVQDSLAALLAHPDRIGHWEFRKIRKDGALLWVKETARVVRQDGGTPVVLVVCEDITDRKRAEEAIRETELRYRTIFKQAGAGVAQAESHTGQFVQVNRQYCEIVGLTEAEMLATTFGAISHPDDLERDLESMTRLRSGEISSFTMEKRYVRKDGSIVWVNLNVAPLWGPGETPVHHIAIVQDITERKRAEDALRRSECQLRTVLDALPVGVWFTDQSGKPVLANPAAKQIWSGIKQIRIETAANAAGWWEAIGPSNEPHRWALSHALTKGVPSLNETLDLECLDGTKKAIRNTTVPVQDEAGVVLGAIVLNEDITALRQAQEALKLTQFSVDHAVEGFFWIGPDARILNVNEAACRVLEYTRDELTTMTVHDIDPTFHPELWSAHWEELKQKGSMTFESKHWSRTGRVLDTEVTVNYLSYEGREYNCAIMRDIGERKRAEASLGQSEERYRSLVDNAPIGIFVNEDGRFAYVNREMQRILNATSAEQLIGMTVLDRIAPEFHQMVKARISQLMGNGQPVPSLDEQYVRLDGSRVDVAVTAIPTSFDGTPVMQVLVLDIAERKQAEEALRKNHSLLSAIMDTATDFIYVKDLAGRYLLTNPSLAQFMGKSVEEVLGQDDRALLPPELAASCMTADQQVITTGTVVTQEEYGIVGGKTTVYSTTKAPYRDREDRIIGVIGVSRDISERKRAEEELQKSHSFIRQIIDTDPNFVFAKDREGRFTLVNQAVADAYGATVDELIGKTDADFDTNLGEVEFFRKKDLEVMDSLQERFIPEETITDSTGRIRWLQTVKRPILDEQGRAIMVLGAATDITDRKRMEEALRQRERDLRAAIEERERISQDLHDGILQSLFAVGLALEATKLMMSPRNRKTSGPPLDQAIDQLNRVMHEIRNFIAGLGSDLLQGKDLSTALQHMLASLTQNQAIRVRLSVEDRAAQAVSAEQSLHLLLVIQEAVSNCIRHGHAPEAMVSLKMLKQGVRLSIRDNGRGFNQETAKGTGHGLSNMAARARKIGGRFTILSKVNKGTRIVLDLPKEASFVCR